MLLLSSADFFQNINFFKISFRNTIRVLNGWDPDHVGSDLGPNRLKRLSADDKSCCQQENNFKQEGPRALDHSPESWHMR